MHGVISGFHSVLLVCVCVFLGFDYAVFIARALYNILKSHSVMLSALFFLLKTVLIIWSFELPYDFWDCFH
jgi:hypothetical protein